MHTSQPITGPAAAAEDAARGRSGRAVLSVGCFATLALLLGAVECAHAQLVDPFVCYKAKPSKGSVKFAGIEAIALTDRFAGRTVEVSKATGPCSPASVDGSLVEDATTHLESYRVKLDKGQAAYERLTSFRVVDAFGELALSTVKPDRLFVPSSASLVTPVDAPDPNTHSVDHFECYKTKRPKGFVGPQGVAVQDQLGAAALYDLKKPVRLCSPVDKQGEGIKQEDSFLVCYQAKLAKGQAKPDPIVGIHLGNQFGAERLDAKAAVELCMPTLLVQGCGDGVVDDASEECDDANKLDGDGCSSTCTAELPFTIALADLNILQNITTGNPGFDDLDDRLTLLADVIAADPPDILTFQEVVLGVAASTVVADLSARYGLTYHRAEFGFGSGNAVLSRWPVTLHETAILPSSDTVPSFPDRRPAGRVVVESPVGAIDVYSMHLCAGSVGCDMSERSVQADEFVSFVAATHASRHPAIVGGDFNAHLGSVPDAVVVSDPPIEIMQAAGWTALFDGFDLPCNPPADRSGCTDGIDDLTVADDTTTRRIDNLLLVPAAAGQGLSPISVASEVGASARFAATPLTDPNAECHFAPRIACGGSSCPVGSQCNANDFCVRQSPIGCLSNADCLSDVAPEECRSTLWVSDHVGVRSTIELTRLP